MTNLIGAQVAKSATGTTEVYRLQDGRLVEVFYCKSGRIIFNPVSSITVTRPGDGQDYELLIPTLPEAGIELSAYQVEAIREVIRNGVSER